MHRYACIIIKTFVTRPAGAIRWGFHDVHKGLEALRLSETEAEVFTMTRNQRGVFLSIIVTILILFAIGTAHVWNIASAYESEYRETHMEVTT